MLRPGRFRWCRGCPGADGLISSGTAASGVTAGDGEDRRGSAVTSGVGKAGEDGPAWGRGGGDRPGPGPGSESLPGERVQTRGSPGAERAPLGCSALVLARVFPSREVTSGRAGGAKAWRQESRGDGAEGRTLLGLRCRCPPRRKETSQRAPAHGRGQEDQARDPRCLRPADPGPRGLGVGGRHSSAVQAEGGPAGPRQVD